MEIKNAYQYFLSDILGNTVVHPIGEGDFSIEWNRSQEDGKRTYEKQFGGKIIFTGTAYERLLKIEKSIYRCEYQNIRIERPCVLDNHKRWDIFFEGKVSLNSGEWDEDRCQVSLEFEENTPEECFETNKGQQVNLFQQIAARRTVGMYSPNVELETYQCFDQNATSTGYLWCDTGEPEDGKWVVVRHEARTNMPPSTSYSIATDWARLKMQIDCNAPEPTGDWMLVNQQCGSSPFKKTYVKEPSVYDCQYTGGTQEDPDGWSEQCEVYGSTTQGSIFDNGIPLEEIIKTFVQMFCPGLTVKSDFFQINPSVSTNINYVTGQGTKVKNITVFQKSDVKRPNATGNATNMEWTFEKLMETLKYMFNVEWRVEGDKFLIEHVSYYARNEGLNLLGARYERYVKGKRKYSYKTESLPKEEVWKWEELPFQGDFQGLPIVYENGCVTKTGRSNIKTYTIEDVMTDIEYALANSEANSSKVADSGIFLIAAEPTQSSEGVTFYSVITEPGILEEPRPNNTLALAQLMRDYHRHERPLRKGRMNGQETEFLSVMPIKKGVTISIPFCCNDSFNPDDTVRTALGVGVVEKAKFNFKTEMLELDLLYEANIGLTNNKPPVASNAMLETPVGASIFLNVGETATDPDPGATITEVEITMEPMHGIAIAMPDLRIEYRPSSGYIGSDQFTYIVRDNWGQKSNTALVVVIIRG